MKGRVLRPIPGTSYGIGELASFSEEKAAKYKEYLDNPDFFEVVKGKVADEDFVPTNTRLGVEIDPETGQEIVRGYIPPAPTAVRDDEEEEGEDSTTEDEAPVRDDEDDEEEQRKAADPAAKATKQTAKASGGTKATAK